MRVPGGMMKQGTSGRPSVNVDGLNRSPVQTIGKFRAGSQAILYARFHTVPFLDRGHGPNATSVQKSTSSVPAVGHGSRSVRAWEEPSSPSSRLGAEAIPLQM
jgi:hypothetical protein